jgi:hypothetical protein
MKSVRLLPLILLTAALLGWRFFFAAAHAENAPVGPVAPPAAAGYRVGAAQQDITPDLTAGPVNLHCYGDRDKRPATGVLDPLHVRAVTIADPHGKLVALVSADLCYINSELRDRVVERLAPYGFDENNLLLAATHTHSGCANYDRRWIVTKFFGDFQQRIFDHIVDGVVNAVIEAQRKMQPATIEVASAEIEPMNRSRRDPAFDINTGTHPANVTADPVRYPTDRFLTLVRFVDANGKPIAVNVHYSSHATILSPKNLQISADWPGEMCARVAEALGDGVIVSFFNGSEGDAAPLPDWANDVQTEIAQMRQYGRRMAEHVLHVLPQTRPVHKQFVGGFTARRNFDRVTMRFAWGITLPRWLTHQLASLRPDAPFQAMRVGDLVLLAVPGEPTTAVGKQLKALVAADSLPLVIAPANDYLGYFTMPDEYAAGGYEADSTLFGPHAAQRVVDAMSVTLSNLENSP